MKLYRLAIAGCMALFAAAASVPALAVEPAPGSRNFEPPTSVPNYFSNEAGPFRGGAGAETTYSNSGPVPAVVSPYAPSRTAAAAPRRSASRHAARSDRHRRYAYAHSRSRHHAARTRIAARKHAKLTRIAHARGRPTVSKSKIAARASGSKRHPGSAKSRPVAKHAARTASR